ncbi:TPA: hypothetical protein NGT37_001039 [Vibrio parahaemolyticus]|nr:hypothetical protein [Vibrio parahaemolyticus]
MDISINTSVRRTRANAVIAQIAKFFLYRDTNLASGKSKHVRRFEVNDSEDLDNPVSNPYVEIEYDTGGASNQVTKRVEYSNDNQVRVLVTRGGSALADYTVFVTDLAHEQEVTLSNGSTVTAYRTSPYIQSSSDEFDTFLLSRGVNIQSKADTP